MLRFIYQYLLALQLNPLKTIKSLASLPWYLSQKEKFKKLYNLANSGDKKDWVITDYPIFLDRKVESASLGEYFWQDLLVAREIMKQAPIRHVDVGSRVDGFIAHLACMRRVEVFDIRPLSAKIENVEFTQWDITDPNPAFNGVADCVSCLHTLEHIGLGRYGDQLDPDGWRKGLKSLVNLVAPGGGLWLSVPIGIQRIEFNAHRVFAPKTLCDQAASLNLILEEFYWYENGTLKASANIAEDMKHLATVNYSLGIFLFRKS